MSSVLVWFKKDLRLLDNPALFFACDCHKPVIPIYIYDETLQVGSAQKWWLHHSLEALRKRLETLNLPLIIRQGDPLSILINLIQENSINEIYWNRCYEPLEIKRDSQIKRFLREKGITVKSFNASLLFDPLEIKNNQNNYFKVFGAFWKKCSLSYVPRVPFSLPLPSVSKTPTIKSDSLFSLNLLSKTSWAEGFSEIWEPGEEGALKKLDSFLENKLLTYKEQRDFPALESTSKLSPHLHFGKISPHLIWQQIHKKYGTSFFQTSNDSIELFLRELGWREFCTYILYHFPDLPSQNFIKKFDYFKWNKNENHLEAWQKGATGYPIIDARMRQLWKWGWMHNRIRMIVASFLTKNLLIDWRQGQRWFEDTLVDADLANNSAGWQWTAGTGIDAAPYFRIFNPITQGQKFDPQGDYIREWVPELSNIPLEYIHCPWKAPQETLRKANLTLGQKYPYPIVDYSLTRKKALELYHSL